LHRSIERLQSRLVEAGANMPSIDPGLPRLVTYREYQRAKVLAGLAQLSVTDVTTSCSCTALNFSHSRIRFPEK
jgi:hypothetical protein